MQFRSKTQRLVLLGLLISMAIVLGYFERFIPLPWNVPGMKLGLANIITLSAFYFFNKKSVFALVVIRVIMTSLLVGSMMSFFYSMMGGLLSFLGMAVLHHWFSKSVSPIGISILGALLHNLGQLFVLAIVSQKVSIAISYAPLIMITAIATGIFVGVASIFFIKSVPLTSLKSVTPGSSERE